VVTQIEADAKAACNGSSDGIKRLATHTYLYGHHARWAGLVVSANAENLLPRLVEAMASQEPDLRNYSARLLGILGPEVGPQGAQALIAALQSPDERLRMTAITALGQVGSNGGNEVFDALSLFLPHAPTDSNSREKLLAIAAIGECRDSKARQVLEHLLEMVHEGDHWYAARQSAAIALAKLGDSASVSALRAAVNHDTSFMFHPVTAGLIDLAPNEAATLLLRFTTNKAHGKDAVGYLEELLAFQSRHVSVQNLQLAARLTGVRQNIVNCRGAEEDWHEYVSGDEPVGCQVVRELAKKELRRRGVKVSGCFRRFRDFFEKSFFGCIE
jgi:hypothetical protein